MEAHMREDALLEPDPFPGGRLKSVAPIQEGALLHSGMKFRLDWWQPASIAKAFQPVLYG